VAVLKPAQTGIPPGSPEEPDAETVARLAGPHRAVTLVNHSDPLAPATAARVADRPALAFDDVTAAVRELAAEHDLVLIEGAGGLLVPMGVEGWTVADLAVALAAPVVVVARAGLGTLNHTALTLEALDRRGRPALVVIGAWPERPELVHRTNLADLPGTLAGVLPDGVGGWQPGAFRAAAPAWLTRVLHGRLVRTRSPARDEVSPPGDDERA
jgi:dethiobiotin synthetase